MALPKIRVVKPKPGDAVLECLHAGSSKVTEKVLKQYVGVPTISVPAHPFARPRELHFGSKFNVVAMANFHVNGDVIELPGDFVEGLPSPELAIRVRREPSEGWRANVQEKLFPPSPFNRFFKTE